ncbi:hypothetical protein Esti_006092 [Eimeria stiedai]
MATAMSEGLSDPLVSAGVYFPPSQQQQEEEGEEAEEEQEEQQQEDTKALEDEEAPGNREAGGEDEGRRKSKKRQKKEKRSLRKRKRKEERKQRSHKRQRRAKQQQQQGGGSSSSPDSSEEEDVENEEELLREEMKGFIVSEAESDSDTSSSSSSSSSSQAGDGDALALDEEDLDLIAENTGLVVSAGGAPRGAPSSGPPSRKEQQLQGQTDNEEETGDSRQQFRRLKKAPAAAAAEGGVGRRDSSGSAQERAFSRAGGKPRGASDAGGDSLFEGEAEETRLAAAGASEEETDAGGEWEEEETTAAGGGGASQRLAEAWSLVARVRADAEMRRSEEALLSGDRVSPPPAGSEAGGGPGGPAAGGLLGAPSRVPKSVWDRLGEPDELAKGLATARDESIARTDFPERLQLRLQNRHHAITEASLAAEALWISKRLLSEFEEDLTKERLQERYYDAFGLGCRLQREPELDVQQKVLLLLQLLLQQGLEVVFILEHRMHLLSPPLSAAMVWRAYELDIHFVRLKAARGKVLQLAVRLQQQQQQQQQDALVGEAVRDKETAAAAAAGLKETVLRLVREAETETEVEDVRLYLLVNYHAQLAAAAAAVRNRSKTLSEKVAKDETLADEEHLLQHDEQRDEQADVDFQQQQHEQQQQQQEEGDLDVQQQEKLPDHSSELQQQPRQFSSSSADTWATETPAAAAAEEGDASTQFFARVPEEPTEAAEAGDAVAADQQQQQQEEAGLSLDHHHMLRSLQQLYLQQGSTQQQQQLEQQEEYQQENHQGDGVHSLELQQQQDLDREEPSGSSQLFYEEEVLQQAPSDDLETAAATGAQNGGESSAPQEAAGSSPFSSADAQDEAATAAAANASAAAAAEALEWADTEAAMQRGAAAAALQQEAATDSSGRTATAAVSFSTPSTTQPLPRPHAAKWDKPPQQQQQQQQQQQGSQTASSGDVLSAGGTSNGNDTNSSSSSSGDGDPPSTARGYLVGGGLTEEDRVAAAAETAEFQRLLRDAEEEEWAAAAAAVAERPLTLTEAPPIDAVELVCRLGLTDIWSESLLSAEDLVANLNFICFQEAKPFVLRPNDQLPRAPAAPPPQIPLASPAEIAAAAAAAAAAGGSSSSERELQLEVSAAAWVDQWRQPPFTTGAQLLSLLVHFNAKMLASHCGLRRMLRQKLERLLSVSVVTTPKGEKEADPAKPCWFARRLWRLPVTRFLEEVLPQFSEKPPCLPWNDRARKRHQRVLRNEERRRHLQSLPSAKEKEAFLESCREADREERERRDNNADLLLRPKKLREILDRRRDNPLSTLFVQVQQLERQGEVAVVLHPLSGETPPWRREEFAGRHAEALKQQSVLKAGSKAAAAAAASRGAAAEYLNDLMQQQQFIDAEQQQFNDAEAVDQQQVETIVSQMLTAYTPFAAVLLDGSSSSSQVDAAAPWVYIQRMILWRLVYNELLPAVKRDARDRLLRAAQEAVLRECQDMLHWKLCMQPLKPTPQQQQQRQQQLLEHESSSSSSSSSSSDSDSNAGGSAAQPERRRRKQQRRQRQQQRQQRLALDPTAIDCLSFVVEHKHLETGRGGTFARVHAVLVSSWGEVEAYECFDVLLNARLPDEQQQQQQGGGAAAGFGGPPGASQQQQQQQSLSRDMQLALRDLQRLARLLAERSVDVAVIGVRDRHSLLLQQILKQRIFPKVSRKRRPLAVVLAPLEIPAVWAGSDRVPENLRRTMAREALMALSLGRYVQDPLAEAASLWGEGAENLLLQLKLHPLQAALPRDRLAAACESVLLRLVGDCGVDLRRCMRMHNSSSSSTSSSTAALLQFVPGLGPRKAQRLLNMLKSSALVMRSQLCMAEDSDESDDEVAHAARRGERDAKGLGPRVYRNCAAFLSLKTSPSAGETDALDALDATRIHPTEGSAWLGRLCHDALETKNLQDNKEEKEEKDASHAEETDEEAIAEVLKDPSLLDNLDLEEFAAVLKDDPEGCRMLPYLEFMVSELRHPFRDRRLPFCPLSDFEVFYLGSGETVEELHEGVAVNCHVAHASGIRVYAHLKPSNIKVSFADLRELRGVMAMRNKASCPEEEDLSPLSGSEILPARVLRIFFDAELDRGFPCFRVLCVCTSLAVKHTLSLLCAESKSTQVMSRFLSPIAPCDLLGTRRTLKFEREEVFANQQTQQLRRHRPIRHPNYKACSHHRALQFLQDSSVPLGEALFRPASHRDGFVLMLKSCSVPFRALCLQVEEPAAAAAAAAGDAAAAASGQIKELVLLGNTYDSFDQIIAVFCEPLRMNLEEIARHPKFRGTDVRTALKELRHEAASRPDSIAWCLLPPTSHSSNAGEETEGGAGSAGRPAAAAAAASSNKRDNPLRFHLLVVPPRQKDAASDVFLIDGIYVDSAGFKLWRHKETSLRALIQWWKQSGYWNRRQHLAEYAEEKQRLMAETAARRRDRELLEAQQQQQLQQQLQQQQYYVETAIQPRRDRFAREYVERAARAAYTPKIGGEVRQRQGPWGGSPYGGSSQQAIPAEADFDRRPPYGDRNGEFGERGRGRDRGVGWGPYSRGRDNIEGQGGGFALTRREGGRFDDRGFGRGYDYRDRDRDKRSEERLEGERDSYRYRRDAKGALL